MASTTIVEVAKALGVAPSTVSRAFNRPHMLLPETVARVREVAAEMGYVPNRHARALSTGRTSAIGLVLPDITNPFFPPIVRAAQQAAEERDVSVLVAETDNDPRRELRQLDQLRPQVEGILLASSRLPEDQLDEVVRRDRVVLLNRDHPGAARVLIGSGAAVTAAVAHLAATGSRRLCYVGGPRRSWSEHERLSAVVRAAEEHGLTVTTVRVESGTYDDARSVAESLHPERTDAVIAFDDVVAHGIIDGLAARGVTVPGDVRLVGCDDALPIQTHPRLSTIRLPSAQGVRRAVEVLLSGEGAPLPESRELFDGTLCLRETT
ncbi:LacI family DNA-binding transcriptional regulator [Georgenia satyanarayanai]|uniref:LacI family DNA-binding transcriptional regulator n=1 Tax=Georgenia satyanarayanai TaxID=860221 RepID=UPI00186B07EB|nr:LacI family DNA-binding transcriptional regulator [Georgenia satyanarayanai]